MVLWLHGLAPPYETPIFEVVPKWDLAADRQSSGLKILVC